MRRIILLSIICLCALHNLCASPVTYRQAAENARKFVSSRPGRKFAGNLEVAAVPADGIQPYYIFNIGTDEGYVIIAGDDAVSPVIGYSYEGRLDTHNIPYNMQLWLDGYAHELTRIQKLNLPARNNDSISQVRENIPAMITSKWNQKQPYNRLCPLVSEGSRHHRPTGCVATATAQVMYYHKWPEGETSAIDGYTYKDEYIYGGDGSERKEEALSPTVFDWESMTDEYEDETKYSEKSADAVAKLMLYVGHSVKMAYGKNASGAFTENIPAALICSFGYKNTARVVYRSNYENKEDWESLIYKELSENRPVVYGGLTLLGEGHQFVCDGYENEYFHINWGWGGVSDGFFKLELLDPENQGVGGAASGSNFCMKQSAIIGIEKPVEDDAVYIENILAEAGDKINVGVMMNNVHKDYTSLQFDMQLPEGVDIVYDENGYPEASFNQLRSEKEDHGVNISKTSANIYRFVAYSSSNSAITGKDGAIIQINLKINGAMQKGSYQASICNVTVCDKNLNTKELSDRKSEVNIVGDKTLTGDANNDGEVDEADVESIVKHIMEKKNNTFISNLADTDADGKIDIYDALRTQDIFLKNTGADRHIFTTETDSADVAYLQYLENGLTLMLQNNTCYKGVQMDLIIPCDISVTDAVIKTNRINGFNVIYNRIGAEKYRVLIYSSEGKNIEENNGAVADFIMSSSITEAEIKNIVFVTSDMRKVTLNDAVYKETLGIDDVRYSALNKDIIYTVQGIPVRKKISELRKGMYIINGKKMVIKK